MAAGAAGGNPQGFAAKVDNPWFPLKPGTRYIYVGYQGRPTVPRRRGRHAPDAAIHGAPCVVVPDRLYVDGKLHERTTDWYTQDAQGNVWYFGEDDRRARQERQRHEHRRHLAWPASTAPSPGSTCRRHPTSAGRARQEYYKGQAEDHFQVSHARDPSISVRSPSRGAHEEWTPLEPGVVDHKLYVRGVGTVIEQTVKGGDERNELISVTDGA